MFYENDYCLIMRQNKYVNANLGQAAPAGAVEETLTGQRHQFGSSAQGLGDDPDQAETHSRHQSGEWGCILVDDCLQWVVCNSTYGTYNVTNVRLQTSSKKKKINS